MPTADIEEWKDKYMDYKIAWYTLIRFLNGADLRVVPVLQWLHQVGAGSAIYLYFRTYIKSIYGNYLDRSYASNRGTVTPKTICLKLMDSGNFLSKVNVCKGDVRGSLIGSAHLIFYFRPPGPTTKNGNDSCVQSQDRTNLLLSSDRRTHDTHDANIESYATYQRLKRN